jgi:hypothetical protein
MNVTISSLRIQVDHAQHVSAEMLMPQKAKAIYVFAHGAGAGMNHTFMKELSTELANHQVATLRYNFLYMELKKKRPDFPAVAHKAVAAAIQKASELSPELALYAGGKSFGGRMTSQFLASQQVTKLKGIIFVGFPLHPAGSPAVDRAEHLQKINLPMLFLQGNKDALAEWKLLLEVTNALPSATLVELEGADHAFKMPKKKKAIPVLAEQISTWIDRINR